MAKGRFADWMETARLFRLRLRMTMRYFRVSPRGTTPMSIAGLANSTHAMEDWELFSKLIVGGFRLETVPKPLYWYRIRESSHSKITAKYANNLRTIRPYLQELPQALHPLALFAQGVRSRLEDTRAELEAEVEGGHKLAYSLSAVANSLTSLCAKHKVLSPHPGASFVANGGFEQGGGERGGPRRQLAPALQWIHGGP